MMESTSSLQAPTYEEKLNQQPEWAMDEGSLHFDEKSQVHVTLKRLCKRLNELGIAYAIAGGMALFKHGLRRFTEDVDVLVNREDLKLIHEKMNGRGYLPVFEHSKNLRDTVSNVRIEFLLAGDFPGDGKAKPVAFPSPRAVGETKDGMQFLKLPTLIELKLASGMTGADRIKDLADVQELIKLFALPEDYGDQLNPYVRDKYQDLWRASRGSERRYIRLWRNKILTVDAQSIDEMIETLTDAADTLRNMRDDGVTLDSESGTADDYAHLVTSDPDVARKYDMHEESEFWDEHEADS